MRIAFRTGRVCKYVQSIYYAHASKMLSVGILLNHAFPSDTYAHIIHALWYLIRSFLVTDTCKHVDFEERVTLPKYYAGVLLFPLISLALTIPQLALGDMTCIPYVLMHVMGYPKPIWYTVICGAYFTVYLTERPMALFVSKAAILYSYMRFDYREWALRAAMIAHLVFVVFFVVDRVPGRLDVTQVLVNVLMAEAKIQMVYNRWWHWETLVPPVEPLSFVCLPMYVSNLFLWGWHRHWEWTDKVWKDPDILFLLANIAMAGLYIYFRDSNSL